MILKKHYCISILYKQQQQSPIYNEWPLLLQLGMHEQLIVSSQPPLHRSFSRLCMLQYYVDQQLSYSVAILNHCFNQPLLSLQVAKCELQLAFWTQLSRFFSPCCMLLLFPNVPHSTAAPIQLIAIGFLADSYSINITMLAISTTRVNYICHYQNLQNAQHRENAVMSIISEFHVDGYSQALVKFCRTIF